MCWLLPATAGAQIQSLYLQPLPETARLQQSTVSALIKDSDGFVWIATQAGLHRFDGFEMRLLQHEPANPASLPNNFVSALAEDARKQLWIGTNSDYLVRLDLHTGNIQALGRRGETARNSVQALSYFDRTGLWVGTSAGVEKMSVDSPVAIELLRFDGEPRARVYEFERIGDDVFAATTAGLYRFAPPAFRPVRVLSQAVMALAQHRGRLWIGSAQGLFEWHAGKAEKVWPEDASEIRVDAIEVDPQKRVWIASRQRGLARINPFTNEVLWLPMRANVRGALPDDNITLLKVDDTGLLWVGTGSAGVLRVQTEGNRTELLRDFSDPSIRSNNVRSMLQTGAETLWIGTETSGLKRFDFRTQQFTDANAPLRALLGPNAPDALRVMAILPDADRLWLGTDRGLITLNPERQLARRATIMLEHGPDSPIVARNMVKDRQGKLWIGTTEHGLLEFDPSKESTIQHLHDAEDPNSLPDNLILSSYCDAQGRLWFGTMRGIGLLDVGSGSWQRLNNAADDPSSLPSDIVRHFYQDERVGLWVATHNGAARITFEGQRPRFERIKLADVLPSLTVYSIAAMGETLWLSSNAGLVQYELASGDRSRLDLVDGLQDLEFNGGAVLKLADGRLAFGGINGINLVPVDAPVHAPHKPRVQALRFLAGGQERLFGLANFAPLLWQDRDVQIDLAGLEYRDPPRNRVEWRLDGVDQNWRQATGRVSANYGNLLPGRYLLRAHALAEDGARAEQPFLIPFSIGMPWWLSRQAMAVFCAVIVLSLWFALWLVHARTQTRRAYVQQIRDREQRLLVSLWGSGDDYWDWHIDTGVMHRQGTEHLLGKSQDGAMSEADWMSNVVHPDDLPAVRARVDKVLNGEVTEFHSEHRIRGTEGWIWVLSRGKIVERNAAGKATRMAGTARNVTQLRASQEELRIAAEVIRSMGEAVIVLDKDFRVVSGNPAFARVTGFSFADIEGQSARFMESPRHSLHEYLAVIELLRVQGHWRGDFWLRRKSGTDLYAQVEAVKINRDQSDEYFVLVINDLTDRKRAEMELSYLANFDGLTGLPNRAQFLGKLASCVRKASRRKQAMALLFVDLDRFKQINDTLGHSAGDELLKATSQRLTTVAGSTAMVSRLGGDEFTIVLPEIACDNDAVLMAAAVIEHFAEPFNLGGNEVVVSPSIGIAIFPQHGEDPATLLKHADVAMYSAKEAGRNAFRQYNDAIAHLTRQRVVLEAGLRRALERREFQLVYQPIVQLSDGDVRSVEALLRWHHPELGTIPPDVFVPILEESGMVVQVGAWVLNESLQQLSAWHEQGLRGFRIAINLSMLQLLRGEIELEILGLLERYKLPGEVLELELTESMVMANPEQSIRILDSLAGHGIGIVVDDFGTGYSSLAYLKKLPIEKLKIDKSFIRDIGRDADGGTIVNIVIALAHVLNLRAIAEGVETEEQKQFLASNGCDEIQGFLLTRALPPEELAAWIRQHRAADWAGS